MKYFVGIDLGTTNSSIAIYDGEEVRICKSLAEQSDVTPSAIVIDRRGNKFIGTRAYDIASVNPDNSAILFKRLMGSNTKITFASSGEEKTPEECSAEILKTLYGYLPEEIRTEGELGTVITIPAAFNQMQKDATVQAASMAGIGRVALMQEPVAAVMSAMKNAKIDGFFLIYDLGGGTLDIAIAESINGRVNLVANGGIQMCGGRDIDRGIFDNIVRPWLHSNFNLPQNIKASPKYSRLARLANWAIERAKIELSARDEANITLSEMEIALRDESDEEIYIDITLTRDSIAPYVEERVQESVIAARETLQKASLTSEDIQQIVFIGGPTNYKPLRDRVCEELQIAGNNDLNPMTAVAEGAALFAESIDWRSEDNSRKSSRGNISSEQENFKLSFAYTARTPENEARIQVRAEGEIPEGCEFQVDSLDTGWTSGRKRLENGAGMWLPLTKHNDNRFKVSAFDSYGNPIKIKNNDIIITKTTATVNAITASHSIGVAVRGKDSRTYELVYLVKAGDDLPVKGTANFKAAESLKSGTSDSLNFRLFEGEIKQPVTDNRDIGTLKIRSQDIDGIITAGSDLICDYEMTDSGNIILKVSVPSIGVTIDSKRNFYSPQEGQLDFRKAARKIANDADNLLRRIMEWMDKCPYDDDLISAREKTEKANRLLNDTHDLENTQEAQERVLEAKKLLAAAKKNNQKPIRELELENAIEYFDYQARQYAKESEAESFDAMAKAAKRNIPRPNNRFEEIIEVLLASNKSFISLSAAICVMIVYLRVFPCILCVLWFKALFGSQFVYFVVPKVFSYFFSVVSNS